MLHEHADRATPDGSTLAAPNATREPNRARPVLNAAVLGAGMLGLDLVQRLSDSPMLNCVLVAGRAGTVGLRRASRMGCVTSTGGVAAIAAAAEHLDVVFDASAASDDEAHRAELIHSSPLLVDLTPSDAGLLIALTVNGDEVAAARHVGLVSCGGQAAVPVLRAASGHCTPRYVEVVTTAASASVGPASRRNLDEYLATTETALCRLTGVPEAKVLATLSPATPPPVFRVQLVIDADEVRPEPLRDAVQAAAGRMRRFVPGYEVTSILVQDHQVRVSVQVSATRAWLPRYAGNVEIITASAVELAERYASLRCEG